MATRANHGERIAALETAVVSESKAIRDHIDAKHNLILANLQPYLSMKETVDRHTHQISFWRGAIAVIGFVFTATLGYFGIERR